MPDLLIELFSEEIPARMQARAREDLKSMVTNGLVEAGLTYASAGAFSTPRRLALSVEGLTGESRPVREERKGPSASAPAHGFRPREGADRGFKDLGDDFRRAATGLFDHGIKGFALLVGAAFQLVNRQAG